MGRTPAGYRAPVPADGLEAMAAHGVDVAAPPEGAVAERGPAKGTEPGAVEGPEAMAGPAVAGLEAMAADGGDVPAPPEGAVAERGPTEGTEPGAVEGPEAMAGPAATAVGGWPRVEGVAPGGRVGSEDAAAAAVPALPDVVVGARRPVRGTVLGSTDGPWDMAAATVLVWEDEPWRQDGYPRAGSPSGRAPADADETRPDEFFPAWRDGIGAEPGTRSDSRAVPQPTLVWDDGPGGEEGQAVLRGSQALPTTGATPADSAAAGLAGFGETPDPCVPSSLLPVPAAWSAPAPTVVPRPPLPAYEAPPLDLLRRKPNLAPMSQEPDTKEREAQLDAALKSFGVTARIVGAVQGPSVTRFEIEPGAGVKVARIAGLAEDLALALKATDVRIAPVPGKSAVGIEVPNTDVSPVFLREVMESEAFRTAPSPLTVCLGQDIAGKPVVANLEQLLHVLVAGATGSGKSITINSMLVSLLYKAGPDQVRLVLVDPKMVELSQYNGIPHLLAPVVTNPRKAAATLQAVVREMERRYTLFTHTGVRNLNGYNAVAWERGGPPLPYVVIVIDELADLMLVARAEVEGAVQRLTQMARAAGIYLIVATQRPSVDVITGVIKANIPTRIALAVSSHIDSRTIIDVAGAEKLVGRGDMLFRPVGAQKMLRAQGAFVSESEVESVIDFLQQRGAPEYQVDIMEAEPDGERSTSGSDGNEDDELFVDALQIVLDSGQASVSNLQRRLRVGFTRAGRLIDMMEHRGFVGPHQGSRTREVLITSEQFQSLYGPPGDGG